MIIVQTRSSAVNNWELCQQQYFLTYGLGYESRVGVKAIKGTACHKVLEILALITQSGKYEYKDEIVDIKFTKEQWFAEEHLSVEKIDKLNSTRVNKSTYLYDCRIPYGQIQYGGEVVEQIIQQVYKYYTERSELKFAPVDLKDVRNYVHIVLDYKNRIFDPRKRNVFAVEQRFSLEIPGKEFTYNYDFDGTNISGQLRINGTIDFITKIDDETLEIIDYKSGLRTDFATGEVKTFKKLQDDKQLMLYYYAARRLFPQYKNIIMSIFFIRDGGAFTLNYDDATIPKVLKNLKKHFDVVRYTEYPKMLSEDQSDFRCNRVCHYYKQTSPCGTTNMCKFINNIIQEIGINETINKYKNSKFDYHNYQSPGE